MVNSQINNFTSTVEFEGFDSKNKKTILLIEDDVMILELLHEVLTKNDYEVLIAKNATDGLELFKKQHNKILSIVMDYEIPGMHPSRLIEKILEVEPDIKIVISSGYTPNFVNQEFQLSHISCYLSKPYDPKSLVDELRKF